MEVIFPDWSGPHPALPDPRPTILVPFPRPLPDLAPAQRVVLDSGAFGRSFQPATERQPLAEWFVTLATWYRAAMHHYGDRLRWCVAPDVFGDPRATLAQYAQWRADYADIPVAPVIQLWPNKPFDLMTIQRQSRTYGQQPHIMLSNPAKMTAARWGATLTDACAVIRHHAGAGCHIHLLGAGWSPDDVLLYRRVIGLSSIDSITYYLAAQRGERWCRCCTSETAWQIAAGHHATVLLSR